MATNESQAVSTTIDFWDLIKQVGLLKQDISTQLKGLSKRNKKFFVKKNVIERLADSVINETYDILDGDKCLSRDEDLFKKANALFEHEFSELFDYPGYVEEIFKCVEVDQEVEEMICILEESVIGDYVQEHKRKRGVKIPTRKSSYDDLMSMLDLFFIKANKIIL
jgi:hypothetical protein